MSQENNLQTTLDPTPGSKTKLWLAAGISLLIIGLFLFFKPSDKTKSEAPAIEPKFHRDEPTKGQIYQNDYKEKIGEMIDSGKKVGEISRETGIRRDEIKRIKKEKTQATKDKPVSQ